MWWRGNAQPAPLPRVARLATAGMFFVNGAGLANWVARIPAVQQRLGLSTGALGFALLGAAVGSLIAMPLVGGLIARFGSRTVTSIAAVAYCLTVPLPAFAPSLWTLWLMLAVLGACTGSMDVAMNSQAIAVERSYGRPIMVAFHGMYSLGGLAGAATGGIAAALNVAPAPHLVVVAVVLGVAVIVAGRGLMPHVADAPAEPCHPSRRRGFIRPSRVLLGLGLVAFCSTVGEGAMGDWTAVYLRETVATSAGFAAAGYAAFSLAMAAGRFGGDWMKMRLGAVRLVRLGGALCVLGILVAVVFPLPAMALLGFACVGLGLSGIVPIAFSAAGTIPGQLAGPAIATASTIGYCGFLVGPPLIGYVAEVVTLRGGLGVVALLGGGIVLLAPLVRQRQAPEAAHDAEALAALPEAP